jgi:hypothetical protein
LYSSNDGERDTTRKEKNYEERQRKQKKVKEEREEKFK